MRASLFSLLPALCLGTALAQSPAPAGGNGQRPDQKIERIQVEDGGARIDELRVGGETQSITVQPKANVPEYEVLPADGARSNSLARRNAAGPSGPRVWNIFKF